MLWRNLQGSGWRNHDRQVSHPVAKFIIPDWEDKVNSDIRLSCRPTRLHWLAGRYDNPVPESTISPVSDYEFGYSSQY